MSPPDAYFAGFLDGEGSIGYVAETQLRVQTVNTYLPVLEALRERFGGRIHSRRTRSAAHKPQWCHVVCGHRAYDMLAALRPFLSVKLEQAEAVLALPRPEPVRGDRTHCRYGHPFDAENTYIGASGSRSCRTCDRERHAQRRQR